MFPNESCPVSPNDPDSADGHYSPALIALRTACITAVSLTIICGNALTLAVMWRVRGEFPPGATKVVMSSLALSDLGVGVMCTFCIPLSVMDRWPLAHSQWPCTLMCSVSVLLAGISTLNLMSLTLDRLIAITKPFSYTTLLSKKRMLCLTIFQWVSSIIFVSLIMTTVQPAVKYNRAAAVCLVKNSKDALTLDVNYLCVMFIFPMAIMLGIYIKLIHTSHQQAKRINAENTSSQGGNSAKAGSGKAVRLFFVVVAVYTVSWLPFCSVRVYADLNPDSLPRWLEFTTVWLAVGNSFWNFIIYIVMNTTFRKLTVEILTRIFKRCAEIL